MRAAFTEIFHSNLWQNPESLSGRGSTLARTKEIRRKLPLVLETLEVKHLLDAGCGDFNWMKNVDLGDCAYLGVDVVLELIEQNNTRFAGTRRKFQTMDISRDTLPKRDAILCRDCLIHFSLKHSLDTLRNFQRSGSEYLLATTHSSVLENIDITSGEWRSINLLLPPFNFPEPLHLIVEDPALGKNLGVWRLDSLHLP